MRRAHSLIQPRRRSGVTLVEILVALAVLGVLAAVAAPSFADMMERRRIVAAAGELVSLFNYAKSEANSLAQVGLTMHLEATTNQTSCARLATWGSTDNCSCALSAVCTGGSAKSVREFVLPRSTGVSFAASASAWGPLPNVITFSRNQHGTGVQDVRLTVTGARTGAQLRVEYNEAGRVRTCSPNGSIGGFPTCG